MAVGGEKNPLSLSLSLCLSLPPLLRATNNKNPNLQISESRGITWMTKDGLRTPNYWGSLTQAATVRVGNVAGEEAHAPVSALLPMVHPNDLELGGWDISGLNLADAMERAKVIDWELQKQLAPLMTALVPLPGAHDGGFIAANQGERADNVIQGSKQEQLDKLRSDIREFKRERGVSSEDIFFRAFFFQFRGLEVV